MALGAGITALMVWFNLKRESVLQRIRVFRADLESWDRKGCPSECCSYAKGVGG